MEAKGNYKHLSDQEFDSMIAGYRKVLANYKAKKLREADKEALRRFYSFNEKRIIPNSDKEFNLRWLSMKRTQGGPTNATDEESEALLKGMRIVHEARKTGATTIPMTAETFGIQCMINNISRKADLMEQAAANSWNPDKCAYHELGLKCPFEDCLNADDSD